MDESNLYRLQPNVPVREPAHRVASESRDETKKQSNPGSEPLVSGPLSATIRDRLERFATTDEVILLQGETGTGKTHLARWVHARSHRSEGPFRSVSLATLDDGIVGADLFGYVPGAFTDARERRAGAIADASGGTLFLDEIGKASLVVQRKLLDVLERRSYRPLGCDREVRVNARFVFAASEPLEHLVAEGKMLRDLVPRLGFFRIVMPPLRERRTEIGELLLFFVRQYAPSFGWPKGSPPTVSPGLKEALTNHEWPHNIRELESLVRRLLADARGAGELSTSLLVDDLASYDARALNAEEHRAKRAVAVQEALRRSGGNHSQAARELKMSRSTLYDYLRMLRSGEIKLSG